MSVRAIAVRSGPRPVFTAGATRSRAPAPRRAAPWTAFADDRKLVRAKLLLLGLLLLAAMALEVPW